ncbi:MAG: polynucleotide adenylyltransferase PcnB, partial [Betaproteobacteria bacterium]|nr:polynucleotide adenylyltransferase PcnB [Betaproteobacteria bacterium]
MIRKLFKNLSRLAPGRLSIKALRRSKAPAHEPEIHKGSRLGIDRRLISNAAARTVEELQRAGFKAYVVGGAVRDLLLGIRPKDFDVATNAEPEQIQRSFRRARIIGRRFRLVHVMFGPETIEVSTFRALQSDDIELDEHGRVLRDNVFGEQHEDATRRDFTVNALYYDPVSDQVLDYHHGVKDLKGRVLRMIGDPEHRYREDPVRMLRAVRLAAKLGFEIDRATRRPIREMADLIRNVPNARLFDEMLKLLHSGNA